MTTLILITISVILFIINLIYTRTMVYELKKRNSKLKNELESFKKHNNKLLDLANKKLDLIKKIDKENNNEIKELLSELKSSWINDINKVSIPL